MKEILNSPFKKFFLIGLLCNVVASWFSLGYHQIDEHFMMLEFASYKFGSIPQQYIPWEFSYKIRPTLQPVFAHYCFIFLKSLGISNPFTQVFFLRLLSGTLAWFVSVKLALRLSGNFDHPGAKKWWLLSVACLWFLPYLFVRYSSENYAGIAFLAALLMVPGIFKREPIKASALQWFLCGLLLASSFYFRFQMAFAILGLLFWLLLYAKPLIKSYTFLLAGAVVAVGINLLCDHWFYGEWVISPYNYYHVNIVKDAASTYGTTPWYDYLVLFATQGIPPISWVLLILFLIALIKKPMQLMVFVFVPFLLGHMVVPHKEFRFLYPMAIPFLALCFSGLDMIWMDIEHKKWMKPSLRILVFANALLMSYRCIWPAKPNHFYYKFLYNYAHGKPLHLVTVGRGIFSEGHNQIYLYRPANFTEDTISEQSFPDYLQHQGADSILVMSYQATLPAHDARYTEERKYVYLPDWIMNIQLNDWQSRSDIWSVWLLRKRK